MVTNQESRRMTEFQELVKDAPNFASMERGELVTYAYAMYAAGAKTDAENTKLWKLGKQYETVLADYRSEVAKLREMVRSVLVLRHETAYKWLDATMAEIYGKSFTEQARDLGIEVD